MSATLEGRYLIDSSGETVGYDHDQECVERISQLSFGVVYNHGLGTASIRSALRVNSNVSSVFSDDASADAVAYYAGIDVEDAATVNVVTLPVAVSRHVRPEEEPLLPYYDWTMAVFDWTVNDGSTNSAVLTDINDIWPTTAGRILVLSFSDSITLTGWSTLGPTQYGDIYMYIFDRFDPANGIGESNPHGTYYAPGHGWQV